MYSLTDLGLYLLIYSFLGWVVEAGYYAVTRRQFCNRGVLSLPLILAYGVEYRGEVQRHQHQYGDDHNRSVADRGYVLETGKSLATGTGNELLQDEAVKKAYLGG